MCIYSQQVCFFQREIEGLVEFSGKMHICMSRQQKDFGKINICISRFCVDIGWKKYLNECMPFGYVSLCIVPIADMSIVAI